jgi:TRAP-type C4-dicarboxylate transport system substrate-binding protein
MPNIDNKIAEIDAEIEARRAEVIAEWEEERRLYREAAAEKGVVVEETLTIEEFNRMVQDARKGTSSPVRAVPEGD